MAEKKNHVVVVGGGYAGTTIAHKLDKNSDFTVTLVDPSEFKYHSIAAPRAMADTTGAWVPLVLVPRNLKNGTFVQASAQAIDTAAKTVSLSNGSTLTYDYLVITTGSTTPFLSKPDGAELWTRAGITAAFAALHDQIRAAKAIAVIGGGATGTELAAELRHFNPDKTVALYHNSDTLIGPNFAPKFYKKLDQDLGALGVKVIKGFKATVEGGNTPAATGVFPRPTQGPARVTAGDSTESYDLVINCIGAKLNSKLVQASLGSKVDDRGQVKVNAFLQVDGLETVFSAGDINSHDPARKMAFTAGQQAELLVKNIVSHAAGKKMDTNDGTPPPGAIGFIALGPSHGVGQMPMMGGIVLPTFVVNLFKSTLMVERVWGEVGVPHPAIPGAQSKSFFTPATIAVGLGAVALALYNFGAFSATHA
eukprot:m.49260 g.49260  ORF g.49260 m.49260 type:complete len:422 (-) comp6101_c0_seq1:65-1330(-)